MKVGLFIPCFVDQYYPEVGKATYQLLTKLGCDVDYPTGQTCCGQPMANGGHAKDSVKLAYKFVDIFSEYDYVVGPSGSCVSHVRDHYDIIEQTDDVKHVRKDTWEISDFLVNVLKVDGGMLKASFPHKVGVHNSCHAHRHLGVGIQSELNIPNQESTIEKLLALVNGVEAVEMEHPDECCGFGGTFSVTEATVSVQMGKNRIKEHIKENVEFITGVDMSCLMHMEGILKREGHKVEVKHLVEILNSEL
ncbi:MAG: (Fe-S)-binding protein [Ichthyobacteriaceae bacterium]|nr:(Fe-S)-binding protein [Ichthyobacteriaceae bacterium]